MAGGRSMGGCAGGHFQRDRAPFRVVAGAEVGSHTSSVSPASRGVYHRPEPHCARQAA